MNNKQKNASNLVSAVDSIRKAEKERVEQARRDAEFRALRREAFGADEDETDESAPKGQIELSCEALDDLQNGAYNHKARIKEGSIVTLGPRVGLGDSNFCGLKRLLNASSSEEIAAYANDLQISLEDVKKIVENRESLLGIGQVYVLGIWIQYQKRREEAGEVISADQKAAAILALKFLSNSTVFFEGQEKAERIFSNEKVVRGPGNRPAADKTKTWVLRKDAERASKNGAA